MGVLERRVVFALRQPAVQLGMCQIRGVDPMGFSFWFPLKPARLPFACTPWKETTHLSNSAKHPLNPTRQSNTTQNHLKQLEAAKRWPEPQNHFKQLKGGGLHQNQKPTPPPPSSASPRCAVPSPPAFEAPPRSRGAPDRARGSLGERPAGEVPPVRVV